MATEKQIEQLRNKILDRITEHMTLNNITQEEAARKSGFIQSHISRMLAGKFPPTLDNLIILCEAVGLKVELKSKLYKTGDEG